MNAKVYVCKSLTILNCENMAHFMLTDSNKLMKQNELKNSSENLIVPRKRNRNKNYKYFLISII